ncbi:hypothetical protein, partial [Klebsiella pneumoniae]|uniref:hypothetical protein n=1 Tax=Klebsiella pneumoniae TaxID=573 RepID=UPI001F4B4EA2
MSDLSSKLTELQAQLQAAKAELETAQAKAEQTTDLHEKLNHITRARAAQDVISSIESEIAAVQAAISEQKRQARRGELLEEARAIAKEIAEHREDLEALLYAVSQAVTALQQRAPQIISRWRQSRER